MVKKYPLNRGKVESRRPIDIVAQTDYEEGDVCLVSCADLHFENGWSYGKFNNIGVNSDLEDKYNAFQEAACVASSIGAPFVFAGDLIDQRCVDGVTLDYVSKSIAHLDYKKDIPDYFLIGGNHEFDDTAAIFSTLKHYRYFIGSQVARKRGHIVTERESFLTTCKDQSIHIHCFPAHQHIEKQLTESLEAVRKAIKKSSAKHHVMLLHGGIEGADIGKLKFKGGINSKIIKQYSEIFDWIICGDFHKFQFVNGLKNVYYCGSMKQMNLGDVGQSRGYQILNLTKGTINFIKSDCPTFKVLEVVPGEYIHPWLASPEKHSEKLKNKIFDIKITGTMQAISEFDFEGLKIKMLKCGAFGVYKKSNPITEKRNSMKIDKDNSRIDIITKYVENKFYDEKKERIKKYIGVLSRYAKE